MSETMKMMKRLFWRFWWASPKEFVMPGLYYCYLRNRRLLAIPSHDTPQLIEFPEQTIVIAKDQSQYRPLPAHITPGPEGCVTCCWQFSWRDRLRILFHGKVWHQILTFNQPLQPQLLLVDKPEMK